MAQTPFDETLRKIRRGVLINELTEQMQDVVKAVEDTGKSGEITIKLTIKKFSRMNAIDITDKVTVKLPQDQPESTMMFATPEGNLVTEDPRQQKLPLSAVNIPGSAEVIALKK